MSGEAISFSEADLAQIAATYSPKIHEAPVVLGHPRDNAPAYGWAKALHASGPSLRADLDQLNASFVEGVKAGSYKKVSASFYKKDSPANPTPGKYYLRHIGFLGAQPPAVKGLSPVEFAGSDSDCLTLEFSEATVNLAEQAAEEVAAATADPTVEAVTAAMSAELRAKTAAAVQTALAEPLTTDLVTRLTAALGEGADAAAIQAAVGEAVKAALGEGEGSAVTAAVEGALTESLGGDAMKTAITGAIKGALQPALETAIEAATPADAPASDSVDNSEGRQKSPAELDLEKREAALAKKERELRRAEHTSFVEGVLREGRRFPVSKELTIDLLEHLGCSEVSFGEGDGAKSPLELVKLLLSRAPKEIQFRELSGPLDLAFGEDADPNVVARAAEAYQAEQRKLGNQVSTSEAVNHVKGRNQ